MPRTTINPTYTIVLCPEEFSLVTLALAGLLKDHEDVREARALNTKLCEQRAKFAKEQADVAYKAMCNAQLLENPNTPPTQKG